MALGAQNEQAAGGADLVGLILNCGFELGLGFGEGLAGIQNFQVVGFGETSYTVRGPKRSTDR